MISINIVDSIIREECQLVTVSKNGTHWHFRCPLCGDSKKNPLKKRGHVDWNGGNPGFNCFNCGEHGSFIYFYSLIKGCSPQDAAKKILKFDKDIIKTKLFKPQQKLDYSKEQHKVQSFNYILNDCISIFDTPNGIIDSRNISILRQFKKQRKIPDSFPLYYAYRGKYEGRIIIPIFDKNNLIYFQARGKNPKYLNPTAKKEYIIFNKDNFVDDKFIIIVEGILDALTLDTQGTTLLGPNVNEKHIEFLLNKTKKGVILAPDNDERGQEILLSYLENGKYAKKIKYFLSPLKFKDLNDVFVNINKINMYEFVVQNSFSYTAAYTKLKLGGNVFK